jgi:hypothetical protein
LFSSALIERSSLRADLKNDDARKSGHRRFAFDSAGAERYPRPPSFKAYFFLEAFFLAFFFAFAILALQLPG